MCSRLHEMRFSDWQDVADMLAERGKEVVMSTQTLIESNSELSAQRKITSNGRYEVEANDMGAVGRLAGGHCVAGPHLNLYNGAALALMAGLWQRGGFVPCRPVDVPDLTIGACAHALLRLARREEDPDTLFFSRRLALEGDTELGLLFKNTLDAFDASVFAPATVLRRRRPRAS